MQSGRWKNSPAGRNPQSGTDGWYEFFFDINIKKKPKLLEDGSVDYQNIKWFELVRKGDVVAKYHEPEPGNPGLNILGDEVPAKKGRELPQLPRKGVTLEPDKKTYIASMDGKIEYKGGGLEITNILVQDSVTQATGKVEFNGSIYVGGEVGDGAIIHAEKDILVDGFVEGAVLEAGGDIILRRGSNGDGRGKLTAKGSIMGRFFERSNVKAGKQIHANYCLNSELWAGGKIEIAGKNGSLAGENRDRGHPLSGSIVKYQWFQMEFKNHSECYTEEKRWRHFCISECAGGKINEEQDSRCG